MRLTYIFKMAFRNIWSHKLRSFLTILGIAIGIGFIVILTSVGYGLQKVTTSQISNLNALQIIDVSPGNSALIRINDDSMNKFHHLSNVTDAEAEVSVVGVVSSSTSSIEGVIYGKNSGYLSLEEASYVKGHGYTSDHSMEVIPNESALSALGIKPADAVGKTLDLKVTVSPDLLTNPNVPPVVQEAKYTIIGVLNDQSSPFVYIPLEKFQLMGVTNYTDAKIKVKDQSDISDAQHEIEYLGYKTTTLEQTMTQIDQFFQIFQIVLVSLGLVAVIVASIGMFNTLTISLLEKTKEISFLKILGTTSKDIWYLFIMEAIIIGLAGGLVGIIGGLGFGAIVNGFVDELARQTGNKPVQLFYTPILVLVIILAAIILASFITGIYPSVRASRIDPLKSLRYE